MIYLRFLIFLISIFVCTTGFYAQVSKWNQKFNDTKLNLDKRFEYNDSIIGYYRSFEFDSAMYYARRHLNLGKKTKSLNAISYAQTLIASFHRYTGEFDSAIFYYNEALIGYQKDNFVDGVAATYSNIANVYKQQSKYDLAIKNYFKAIGIAKENGDNTSLVNMYSNLAGLYFKLENYEKAQYYWNLSLKVTKGTRFENVYTFPYRGNARISIERRKFQQAEELILQALRIDKKLNHQIYLYEDYLILLLLYATTNDSKNFREICMQLKQFEKVNIPINRQHFYEFNGDFYFNQKQYKLASLYYDSTKQLINKESNVDSYIEDAQRLTDKFFVASLFAETNGKYANVFDELKVLTKKANSIKKSKLTQELDVKYDLKDAQQKNELLKERNAYYELLVQKNKNQITYLVLSLVIVVFFVAFLFYYSQRLKTVKVALEQSVDEKEFLYKELNHRLKNNLLIVNSFIGIEKQNKPDDVVRMLTTMETRIHSLGLMHELLYNTEMSDYNDLKNYLIQLLAFIDQSLQDKSIVITSELDDDLSIKTNKLSYIGLIVNELITNSIKYGGQSPEKVLRIHLKATKNEHKIQLEVSDDGVGLPADFKLNQQKSLGLKMAMGLTNQMNGDFQILYPERGTLFRILFSLD